MLKAIRRTTILVVSMGVVHAFAGEGDAVETKFEVFHDRNDVTALSPIVELSKTIARYWSVQWEGQLDAVTGASRNWGRDATSGASQQVDAVSGASGRDAQGNVNPEFRYGTRVGATYSNGGRVFSGSLYGSKENDYQSISPSISGSWDFAERNTTLSWAASWFIDKMSPSGVWASIGGGDKRVQSYTLGLTQTLTPLTLGGLTVNYIRTTGYIGHPYNPVSTIDSGVIAEALPDQKDALAMSGQIVQGWLLGEKLGSVNTEYRWYSDSWALRSNTLTLQVSQHFTDATILRLQGRYYNQTATAFSDAGQYRGTETYRTADIRFYGFTSWLVGAKVSSAFPEDWSGWLPRRWDLSYDHMFRNTKGNPLLYQLYPSNATYQQGTARAGLGWDI